MDFNAQLDELQQHLAEAKSAVQAAATESRDQLKQRIEQAQGDVDRGVQAAQELAGEEADNVRSKWAQMKADASARMADLKAKIDKRGTQIDADMAATDAEWAEANAMDAADFAAWAVDNARLAMLDAIDAQVYADERANAAAS